MARILPKMRLLLGTAAGDGFLGFLLFVYRTCRRLLLKVPQIDRTNRRDLEDKFGIE